MSIELFAGIPLGDRADATAWYERLLGAPPAFLPNDAEAVWELADHRFVYVEVRPQHAGHGKLAIVVDDYDARLFAIAGRGLEPDERETYDDGTRKATFRDPDGNEFGIAGAPA